MTWNYRVVRQVEIDERGREEVCYGIHEVYYDEDGVPTTCTVNPVAPFGESPDELAEDMDRMRKALEEPVLDIDSIGGSAVKK